MMLYMLKEAYDILLIYYLKMNRKHNMSRFRMLQLTRGTSLQE